jgi:DNA repair exonuclease SbcCD ATPase subunit
MVGIFGKNCDTGSSNGAGKTSFITAIPAAIYGTAYIPYSVKDLKNRYLDISPRILLEMEIDGEPFIIDRTFGGAVKIKKGSSDWESGTAKDMQERINKAIGLTPDQLLALTLRSQGNFGGFLLMKDSEKKDFLSGFFELDLLEKAHEEVQRQLKSAMPVLDSINKDLIWENSQLDACSKQVDALLSEVKSLSNLDKKNWINNILSQIHKNNISVKELKLKLNSVQDSPEIREILLACEDIVRQINEKQSEISSLKQQLTPESDTPAPIPENLSSALHRKSTELDEAKQRLHQKLKISELLQSQKRSVAVMSEKKASASSELLAAQKQLESLRHQQKCYTCHQPLPESLYEDQLAIINRKIDELNSIIEQFDQQIAGANLSKLEAVLESFSDAEKNIQSIQDELAMINAEIISFQKNSLNTLAKISNDSIKSRILGAQQVIASLERTLITQKNTASELARQATRSIESDIARLEGDTSSLQKELENHQKYLALVRERLDYEQKRLNLSQDKIRGLADKHASTSAEIEILQKTAEALSKNGFVGYLFDGILAELNSGTNQILKSMPLVSNFSLYFSPDKVSQSSGNISKVISYQIYSGNHPVNFESLSGAEKICVVMAVDEALDDVLSRRLGVKTGWKILDEQLMYVDEQNKSAILDFLSNRYSDRSIYIVDHASEFNAALEKRVYIIKENGIASIRSA